MLSETTEEPAVKLATPEADLATSLRSCTARSHWSYGGLAKRCFDVALTLVSLPVILPVGLLLCILIKLDSRGGALVKVQRIGKDGVQFYKYKFRTMVPDADLVLNRLLQCNDELRKEYLATYKIKNDPRITRVGRWLRRTSLDELAQVINVLRGEMSWVGPRDILETELKMYGDSSSKFLTVKPGITGLWQVSGRSRLPYSERVRLDMFYIDNLSFLLDLLILVRTVPVVLLGDGAI
jgi:lipopolysaccharide/colanic/teichoic acid biosynthesis glycosyltransferase